ncbi:MAG: response regulator transcription factor [Gammaproteobacteria bacterium]|nr:response regulator transcription factor [Gammaproteobacteria bacterium]
MISTTKIIIADDHPLFRQALTVMLESHFEDTAVLEADSIADLELLLPQDVDLLLLDLDIPGGDGFNNLINIRSQYPELGVVIISGFEGPETIKRAMYHGAAGFIPKSTPVSEMIVAIEQVIAGNLWLPDGEFDPQDPNAFEIDDKIASLTPQQHKILLMFADGLLNKQIAAELGVSESTVKSHTSTIFLKLGVRNRTQAVIVLNELQIANASFGQAKL